MGRHLLQKVSPPILLLVHLDKSCLMVSDRKQLGHLVPLESLRYLTWMSLYSNRLCPSRMVLSVMLSCYAASSGLVVVVVLHSFFYSFFVFSSPIEVSQQLLSE